MLACNRIVKQAFNIYRSAINDSVSLISSFFHGFQPQLIAIGPYQPKQAEESVEDIFSGVWLFAVPKKKISVSRKRMKHDQYIPEKVNWHFCKKCGEPKLPHKICTKFKDICGLTTTQWLEKTGTPSE